MDMAQILAFLPAILAIIVPPVIAMIKKMLLPVVGKLPKWSIPLLASLVGAIGEMLITQNPGSFVMGAAVGAGGTGVRDVVKNVLLDK